MPAQRWDTTTKRGEGAALHDLKVVDAVVVGGPAG